MKKIYEKPIIVVEQYALTMNVASCDLIVNHSNSNCFLTAPSVPDGYRDLAATGTYFVAAEKDGCTLSASGMTTEDGLCYYTSANGAHTS